ncbi:MAG: FAD-binding oxidoreductase, partial [Deltaproteobacteria bacterium]|nr:FAD-binding oxidoreductase [Deltaproteobacteria bacterium]
MLEKSPGPLDSPLLRDESRLSGWAERIIIPQDSRAASETVIKALEEACPMTFQGARTGLTGAGVPLGGLLINSSRLDKAQSLRLGPEGFEIKLQSGYPLAELRRALALRRVNFSDQAIGPDLLAEFRARELFWPPDPGESGASIGGLVSTNAAGPNRAKFGATRAYVSALTAVLGQGQEYELNRGDFVFGQAGLPLPWGGFLDIEPGHLGLGPGADFLDLLIGFQGMGGFVSSVWLKLKKAPAYHWALVFFLDSQEKAAAFIEKSLLDQLEALVSLDFLDEASLKVIAELGQSAKKLKELPSPPSSARSAVLMELMAEDEFLIERASERILANCQAVGGDPDHSWALV